MSKDLDRMRILMGLNENRQPQKKELLITKKAANNKYYGIVKENAYYFIKASQITNKNKKGANLTESDFVYIGNVNNKLSERYNSYADAVKQLNIKVKVINETYNDLYEAEEEDAAAAPTVPAMPAKKAAPAAPAAPAEDMGDEGMEGDDMEDMGGEDGSEGVDSDLSKEAPDASTDEDGMEGEDDGQEAGEDFEPESNLVDAGTDEDGAEDSEPTNTSDSTPQELQGTISEKMSEIIETPDVLGADEVKSLLSSLLKPLNDNGLISQLDTETKASFRLMFADAKEKNEHIKRGKEKLIREGIEKLFAKKPTLKRRKEKLEEKKEKLKEMKKAVLLNEQKKRKLKTVISEMTKRELAKKRK